MKNTLFLAAKKPMKKNIQIIVSDNSGITIKLKTIHNKTAIQYLMFLFCRPVCIIPLGLPATIIAAKTVAVNK